MHQISNVILTVVIFLFFPTVSAQAKTTFMEDTFEDFVQGQFDDAGQNIYVARDGTIRTIRHYDLNQDGYLDLFFGNTHDSQCLVPPTQAEVTAHRVITSSVLPAMGSDRVRSADLNRDGYPDLVFGLKDNGLQTSRRFITMTYGGPEGFSARRTTGVLPARNPLDIALPDLNADGWVDLIVINKDYVNSDFIPKENVTIYWGSPDGFLLSRYHNVSIPNASAFARADFNGDGAGDVAVLTRDSKIHILYSDTENPKANFNLQQIDLPSKNALCITACDINLDSLADLVLGTSQEELYLFTAAAPGQWAPLESVRAYPASHMAAGHLDDDPYPDLVLCYFAVGTASQASTSGALGDMPETFHVLWGSGQGYSPQNAAALQGKFASAAAIGDLDQDGRNDLAVAVFQGKTHFAAQSLIYFNEGQREFTLADADIPTHGATDALIVPATDTHAAVAVFSNKYLGTLSEKIPVYLYWGSPQGFSRDNRWEIPGQSGHKGSISDLNADGFLDFLVTFTAHGGEAALENPIVGTNIFWGSANGFDTEANRTILSKPWQDHCNVADLNRDGYLDVVLGGWDPWLGPEEGQPAEISLFYGSEQGIDPKAEVTLASPGRSEGVVIADFNQDHYLDIAVTSYEKDCLRIFFNSAEGFDEQNQKTITTPAPIGIECADLNNDGYLDLVVCNYSDRANGFFDIGNIIYWGGPQSFGHANSQWLPGNCNEGASIADFDSDGYLDIFMPSYHAQETRENIPSYLFWGGADSFSYDNKTVIICDSASGSFVGDFDHDGRLDLAISCHTILGKHQTDSKVLYNDGRRFTNPRVEYLPTLGSHYMYVQDMGHIYHRQYQHQYQSAIHPWNFTAAEATLTCQAKIPDGTSLTFSIRSAAKNEDIVNTSWKPLEADRITLEPEHRFLQYRATFRSSGGDLYPTVEKVVIEVK